jgi:hypothetical protein
MVAARLAGDTCSFDDLDFVGRQFVELVNQFIDLRIGRVDLALKIRFGVFVPNAFGVNNLGPFSDQARRAEHPFSR